MSPVNKNAVNKNPKPAPRTSTAAHLTEITGRIDGLADQLAAQDAKAEKRAAAMKAAAEALPKPADPAVVAARVEGARAKVRYVVTGAVIAFVAILLLIGWLMFLHSPLGS